MIKIAPFFLAISTLGCANISFNSNAENREVSRDEMTLLVPQQHTLDECIALLGAPSQVQQSDDGAQYILSYNWQHTSGWQAGVSFPLAKAVNGSFNFKNSHKKLDSIQLIFNQQWQLIETLSE